MKRWLALSGIVLLGCVAIVLSERQKVDTPASPEAVLHLVGDTQQELSRLPMALTKLSDEEEIRIGNELARHYGNGWQPENEKKQEYQAVESYLNNVGSRIATRARRPLPYRFHYLPEEGFINAFALPGGHVFVGAGLLELMDSEDQLAAVLGHEIEHIDLGHCAERVQIEARLRKLHLEALGSLAAIPAEVFEAGYSKEQELAADSYGARLAVAANYSPSGAVRLFETFRRLEGESQTTAKSPDQELSRVARDTLGGYFRSHPPSEERERRMRELIASEKWEARAEKDLPIGYIYWTRKAERAYAAHRYDQAIALCKRSLTVRDGYTPALELLGDASFYNAQFGDAAAAYRSRIQRGVALPLARKYAEALAARGPAASAAREYQDWLQADGKRLPEGFQVELAGLSLSAGDGASARRFAVQLRSVAADPELQGRLGWWYYRAGQYDTANELLASAVEQRPQNAALKTNLAWALVERRQFETALTRFNQVDDVGYPARIGRAVVNWQTRSPDLAISNYETAILQAPHWANPKWVTATQSPVVARTLAELEAERKAREKKSRARK